MIIRINGMEITGDADLHVENAVFEEYANGLNNTLQLTLNDPDGLWSGWINDTINTVQIIHEDFDTGILFAHKFYLENGRFELIARSMPVSRISKRSKEWKDVTFDEIASEVASNLGLSYQSYDIDGSIFYESLMQKATSDLGFFSELCMLEGYGMLIYDQQLIAYNVKAMEDAPLDDVILGDEGVYRFTINPATSYASCTLTWADKQYSDEVIYTGSFTGGAGQGELYIEDLPVTSDAQATRWAKGLLREANKNFISGWYSKPFHATHNPGTAIRIKANKSVQIDGSFFIEKIRYDFKKNQTVTSIRGCLSF